MIKIRSLMKKYYRLLRTLSPILLPFLEKWSKLSGNQLCIFLSVNLLILARKLTYLLSAFGFLFSLKMPGQQPNLGNLKRIGQNVRSLKGSGSDSLHHRNRNEDSITIYYRYLDSTRHYKLDSS